MQAHRRPPTVGRYAGEEIALATRNSGMPLEALRYDLTPAGLHYLLIHFDIPPADADAWRLEIGGLVERPTILSLAALRALPARSVAVTLECAGNGRGQMSPRYPSVPWLEEGVSTAEWTGVALADALRAAGLRPQASELVFHGADRGLDRGVEHDYARSLAIDEEMQRDVLLAYEMNGQPLLPQHGYPLRLIVPGWYGMASVKWLAHIEAVDQPFDGFQQAVSYHFKQQAGEKGVPCSRMRVNSLLIPPGIPDFYSRRRFLGAGRVTLTGRAWSGGGTPVARVEFAVDGAWRDARIEAARGRFAWWRWSIEWDAAPGDHALACRATDAAGNSQPDEPEWDASGFGNNAIQRMGVTVC